MQSKKEQKRYEAINYSKVCPKFLEVSSFLSFKTFGCAVCSEVTTLLITIMTESSNQSYKKMRLFLLFQNVFL